MLCTNTMRKVAQAIEGATPLPLLHIADATADRIRADGHRCVALLGTRFTMEHDFYRGRLEQQHGLEVLVPDPDDRATVHQVIYEELCQGMIGESSRREYQRIVNELEGRGAQGVIVGCTEIGLLLRDGDIALPRYDTAQIHAEAAALAAIAP